MSKCTLYGYIIRKIVLISRQITKTLTIFVYFFIRCTLHNFGVDFRNAKK